MPRRRVSYGQAAQLRSAILFTNTSLALLQDETVDAEDIAGLMRNTTTGALYRITGVTGVVPTLKPVLTPLIGTNPPLVVDNAGGDRLLITGEGPLVIVDHVGVIRTVTLPAGPVDSDTFTFVDFSGNAAAQNITIGRGGKLINGAAADFSIEKNFASVTFVFSLALDSWVGVSGYTAGQSLVPVGGV